MKLKTHNMARKQRTPFTLKSGNKTSFKAMGSSPMQMSFLSPEAAAKHRGQAILPQGGINGQAMATPRSNNNSVISNKLNAKGMPSQAQLRAAQARGDYENFERRLKGEESSNRSRYGQVRGIVNTNAQTPAQPNTPRVAVQSAPRPDLSGGPRQPMSGLGQPMGGPGFGGPGQLPPNKGRRRPGMGSGMGRARRAAGRVRRLRRSRG
jgi:hypothetical protein